MPDFSAYSKDRTEKRCAACQDVLPVEVFRTKRNHGGRYLNNVCRRCEGEAVDKYRQQTPRGIATEIVRRTKYQSKKRGHAFDLDVDWVLKTLEEQDWKCALSRIPFADAKREDEKRGLALWNSISCDRVIPGRGYVKKNVRFILHAVNTFKGVGSDARMYFIAEALFCGDDTHRMRELGDFL